MFSLPFNNGRQEDRFLLGWIGRHKITPRFYTSSRERKFHTYVVGLTGRGKSKIASFAIGSTKTNQSLTRETPSSIFAVWYNKVSRKDYQ